MEAYFSPLFWLGHAHPASYAYGTKCQAGFEGASCTSTEGAKRTSRVLIRAPLHLKVRLICYFPTCFLLDLLRKITSNFMVQRICCYTLITFNCKPFLPSPCTWCNEKCRPTTTQCAQFNCVKAHYRGSRYNALKKKKKHFSVKWCVQVTSCSQHWRSWRGRVSLSPWGFWGLWCLLYLVGY